MRRGRVVKSQESRLWLISTSLGCARVPSFGGGGEGFLLGPNCTRLPSPNCKGLVRCHHLLSDPSQQTCQTALFYTCLSMGPRCQRAAMTRRNFNVAGTWSPQISAPSCSPTMYMCCVTDANPWIYF